jgi:hypothetical protein
MSNRFVWEDGDVVIGPVGAEHPEKVKMHLIAKSEGDEQLVYGEVYSPDRPDAQGEFMRREHIQKMAHDFLRSGKMAQIDVLHNNKVVPGCCVVESFIAPEDDKVFIPGSWVVGVHVGDPDLWGRIKKGEINGFSMEALVTRHDRDVHLDIPPLVRGTTCKFEDHEHQFFVSYDPKGNFKGGVTDSVNGHFHTILRGTHTEVANGHTHRFSAVDNVQILHE